MRFTLADVRTSFDYGTFARGQDYVRRGHVVRLEIASDRGRIDASVKGSLSVPYDVTVTQTESRRGRWIKGECDCPVVHNCKHAAAAAIAAAERFARNGLPAGVPIQPFDAADGAVESWLAAVAAHAWQREDAPRDLQLRYVLDRRELYFVPRIELNAYVVPLLKSGRLGAGRTYELHNLANGSARCLTPIDRTIGRLAAASGLIGRIGNISPKLLAALLDLIVETGRLHWHSIDQPPLTRAALEHARFAWRLDADGRQRPSVHDRPTVELLPSSPLWYVDPHVAQAGPIDLGLDPELAATLVAAPSLNAQQAQRTKTVWPRVFPTDGIAAPHADVRTDVIERDPVPLLRLGAFVPGQGASPGMESFATAQLTFAYDDEVVHPWEDRREFQTIDGDRIMLWPRRLEFERAAQTRLAEYGFMPLGWPHVQYIDRSAAIYRLVTAGPGRRWAHFVDSVAARWRAQGWRIEIDPSFPYDVVHAAGWDAQILPGENRWFELDLGIDVDGARVPLLPIVVEALTELGIRSVRDLDDRVSESTPVYGKLPDGRFVALPAERIAAVLGTLIELFDDRPLSQDGRLALTPAHVASLEELDRSTPVQWAGAQPLRTLLAGLADLDKLPSPKLPATFKATLRPYQNRAVAWLQELGRSGLGGVLADDMGLGKTVEFLAHVAIEKARWRLRAPVLVVAPTSVVPNWQAEIARFVPHLRVLALTGPDRAQRFARVAQCDLALTTYALLHRDEERLAEVGWQIVALDEAQAIKNPRSKAALTAGRLRAGQRIALTGTPMENHLDELWSVFSFAVPGLLGERAAFGRVFRTPIEKRGDGARRRLLAARLRPFLLRRTKEAVAPELPAKTEMVSRVELAGAQRDLYETIRLAMHERVRSELRRRGLARSRIVVLDALLKLRQVCCDPRLLKLPMARGVNESQKLEALLDMVPEMIDEGRRILLFSQFTSMLDLIKPELVKRKIEFVELRGETKDRATPVRRFQAGEVPLFLISLKAGGTGLNLTAADTVIHYDPWWNPAVERQATDRAHRIGQHRPVFVYKLITIGTVEERIVEMQRRKGDLAASLYDESAAPFKLDAEEIDHLFAPI